MTPRTALGALHIGALMFGLTGVFGKLAAASPAIIVFGRAAFAVLALAFFARFASHTRWQKLRSRGCPSTAAQRIVAGRALGEFLHFGEDRRRGHRDAGLCQFPGLYRDPRRADFP
jgi:hypothetical protein